ncbi:unnamed protein product [Auanema sp. JU1783]|nr:unnamed protein product [Auanema sp. JU1783]
MNSLANEWASEPALTVEPESETSVVNMDFIELPSTVKMLRQNLLNPTLYSARHCPELLEHAEKASETWALRRKIHELEFDLSTGALLLSDEYKDHMKMLTTLGYVGKDNIVTFKGRVACEIHHREILIAELLLENKLHDRSPAEVAALLSAFTCQYKQGDGIKFNLDTDEGKLFYQLKMDVVDLSERINKLASDLRLKIMEVGDEVRFDLVPVVYDWAMGKPFSEIMMKTECQEGLIVRCIQRLSELCKDVRNASRIIGDQDLYERMEMVSSAIKRDIVFAASLYTTV